QAHERDFEDEVGLGQAVHGGQDLLAQVAGGGDKAVEQVSAGEVGNDVGSAAAFDHADIEGARPKSRVLGQRHGAQAGEGDQQLINGRLAQFGVGGVRHVATGCEFHAQSAFG